MCEERNFPSWGGVRYAHERCFCLMKETSLVVPACGVPFCREGWAFHFCKKAHNRWGWAQFWGWWCVELHKSLRVWSRACLVLEANEELLKLFCHLRTWTAQTEQTRESVRLHYLIYNNRAQQHWRSVRVLICTIENKQGGPPKLGDPLRSTIKRWSKQELC